MNRGNGNGNVCPSKLETPLTPSMHTKSGLTTSTHPPGCDGYDTSLCGGLDMELFWDIFFWLIPIWIFVLIPFSTFYYEADDLGPPPLSKGEEPGATPIKERSRLSQALCNLSVMMVVVILLLFTAYWFMSESHISVRTYTGGTIMEGARSAGVIFTTTPQKDDNGDVLRFSLSQMAAIQPNDELLIRIVERKEVLDKLTYTVEVSTFYGGFMTYVGWFLFALFGGIGLAALPLHNILIFKHRPMKLTPEELDDAKTSLQDRVTEMVEIGEQLKREREEKSKTTVKRGILASLFPTFFHKRSSTLREFKAAVHLLEEDVRDFTAYQTANEKYNPLYPYVALLMGILSAIFSICWIFQTVLYTLPDPPVAKFLNSVFEWFDSWFPLFGTISVALFTFYLLLCAIQGCFIFGLRFLCLSFYPMKVGKTYMSSFLFNMGLVLFSALPVVQFAVISFDDYARNSTIRQIFVVQIDNLDFFVYFFENDVFVYMFLIISLLTTAYMLYKGGRGAEGAELRDRLKSRGRSANNATPGTVNSSSMGEMGEGAFEDEPEDDDFSDDD